MGTGAGWTPQEVWGYGAWGTLCSLLAGPEARVRAGPRTPFLQMGGCAGDVGVAGRADLKPLPSLPSMALPGCPLATRLP